MGVYIFSWSKMRKYLELDEANPASDNDFGKNIIPAMLNAGKKLYTYTFDGYWKDVGTIESSGKRTWICLKFRCRLTCMISVGASMPVIRACRRTTSPTARSSTA
ncbi:MAG: sugar phosphate nucleotidyltransferase [Christensenellales bacterium]